MKDLLSNDLNEENDNNIQINRDHRKKRSFHRKTESSLFLGEHVYNEPKTIPSIIPDFNYLNLNEENIEIPSDEIIENKMKKKKIIMLLMYLIIIIIYLFLLLKKMIILLL